MAIKKSIKKKWIKALRSGKYEQGRQALFDKGKYCCLGVLAQIVDPERKTWNGRNGYFGAVSTVCTFDDRTGSDPNEQARLLGGCLPTGKVEHLTNLNDGGASFRKIAWIIEKTKSI